MASTKTSKNEEEKKKNKKNEVAGTATPKKTIEKPPTKSPKQDKEINKNNKKTENGRVSESPEVFSIPSSSCDSQEIQDESKEGQAKRSQPKNQSSENCKPKKSNKRKEKAQVDEEEEGICRFPMARVKRIIKIENPGLKLPHDVVFLVNKATEKFIEHFCEEAYECSVRDKKKSLGYKHLSSVVSEQRRFDFLSDFVPERLKAKDALAQRRLLENGQV